MKKAYILVFLFIFALPSTSYSEDYSLYVVKGLNEFQVVVEDLGKNALDMGLSEAKLVKTIELKLLLAGIKTV